MYYSKKSSLLFGSASGGAANQPYTQAFLTASGIADATIIAALNQMEIDLTTDGFIDFGNPSANLFKALYPVVGGTAPNHKWNFLDPQDTDAAFRLTYTGGIVHSATGMLWNGTDGFADSHFVSADFTAAQEATMGYYSRTNDLTGVQIPFGMSDGSGTFLQMNVTSAGYLLGDFATAILFAPADTRGLFTVTRRADNDLEVYRNTASLGTNTGVNASPVNGGLGFPVYLGARNDGGTAAFFSVHECAFAFIGTTGLTAGQVSDLYTNVVQPFQTALSRNV